MTYKARTVPIQHLVTGLAVLLWACAPVRTRVGTDPALWFGGDVHLGVHGDHVLEGLGLDAPLIVNLEGPVGAPGAPSTAERLLNPPNAGELLARAGVIGAGVENNHALDLGPEGQGRTRDVLQAGQIAALGEARWRFGGVPVRVKQIDLTGESALPIEALVRAWCVPHEACVVLFHVRSPPVYLPDPSTREAVEAALRAGAGAVLVHGSHALGALERRGDRVIAWGLGNLAFDCACSEETEGLLVRLQFRGDGRVVAATARPMHAGLHGASAEVSHEPGVDFALLESLGTHFTRRGAADADW